MNEDKFEQAVRLKNKKNKMQIEIEMDINTADVIIISLVLILLFLSGLLVLGEPDILDGLIKMANK